MNAASSIVAIEPDLLSLAVAIGVGLLVGVERERRHTDREQYSPAGIRTFALLALAGVLSSWLGVITQALMLLAAAAFAVSAHLRDRPSDRGLTTEVAMLVVTLLGMLAASHPHWAAPLGVVVAVLLAAKSAMHRFSREVLSADEVRDGLTLAAAALVVLPLLPDQGYGPDQIFNLRSLWQLLVLLLAVGMLGHVVQRLLGARFGLPVAGFFAGFASSTAAVAAFGQRARDGDELAPLVSAALLANLSSLLLFCVVVGSLDWELLRASAAPLGAAVVALLLGAARGLIAGRPGQKEDAAALTSTAADRSPAGMHTGAFRLGHALLLATAISLVLVMAKLAQIWFGDAGAVVTAMLAATAELQAAAASITQLALSGALTIEVARLGLVLLLVTSAIAKTVLAAISGGRRYATSVGGGLLIMLLAAGATLLL